MKTQGLEGGTSLLEVTMQDVIGNPDVASHDVILLTDDANYQNRSAVKNNTRGRK